MMTMMTVMCCNMNWLKIYCILLTFFLLTNLFPYKCLLCLFSLIALIFNSFKYINPPKRHQIDQNSNFILQAKILHIFHK